MLLVVGADRTVGLAIGGGFVNGRFGGGLVGCDGRICGIGCCVSVCCGGGCGLVLLNFCLHLNLSLSLRLSMLRALGALAGVLSWLMVVVVVGLNAGEEGSRLSCCCVTSGSRSGGGCSRSGGGCRFCIYRP